MLRFLLCTKRMKSNGYASCTYYAPRNKRLAPICDFIDRIIGLGK